MATGTNDVLEEEREVLRKEYEWLLENDYGQKVNDIKRRMEECEKKFLPVFQPALSANDVRPIVYRPTSQPADDSISYKVALDGDQILKADISIKLSGKKPCRTGIKEHSAWKLKQIQDCANFFQIAQQQYEVILKSSDDIKRTPKLIQKAFGDLVSTLRKAAKVLIVPQLPDLKEIYASEQRNLFKPELPEDLSLFFHVSGDSLVVSVMTVTPIQRSFQKSLRDQASISWVGSTFSFVVSMVDQANWGYHHAVNSDIGSNTYEVTTHHQVSSQVRWLQDVLTLMKDAQEMAQELLNKVQVFEAYGL